MEDIAIRTAMVADLPALTSIYNHYVRTSHATFDLDEFSVEGRREWFSHYDKSGPHRMLVAERGDHVLGYATSGTFRTKPGYRSSVESSVYLAPGATGHGVGRRLYECLFTLLDDLGVHRTYAGIALPNAPSVALHERLGFSAIGVWTEVGWKLGRYVDVAWFERPHPSSRSPRARPSAGAQNSSV